MKNNESRNRASRKPALNSISLAVLATLIAGGAQAADTSFNSPLHTEIANGYVVSNSLVENKGLIDATVSGSTAATTVTGAQTGNTASTAANTIAASATGNTVTKSLDLSLTMDSVPVGGTASLSRAANTGVVQSSASSNTLAATLRNFNSGTVVNKDNTISATTVVNRGVSSIAGTVPLSYSSTTQGRATIINPAVFADNASIVSTSAQQTVGAASTATASGNQVNLGLVAPNSGTVLPNAALTGNTVSASIKGNSAASTIAIQAGGAPAFAGSAVLSNTQLSDTSRATASNTGSQILGSVSSVSGISDLTGTLAVTGNTLSSSAMGNEALGSTGAAGNRILLGDGLSFAGKVNPLAGASLSGYALGSDVIADLVIANTQRNLTTPTPTPTATAATTSSGSVLSQVERLSNGTINLSDNSIKASATGNAASSALASGANAASFAGSAAVASQQDNTQSGVTATASNAAISATSLGVSNGTVTLGSNRVTSNARGNETSQSLALEATTLALGGAPATLSAALNNVTATGAATVSSLQVNDIAPVTATTANASVALNTGSVMTSTLTLGGNTQEAVALSNNAGNTLSLKGTTVGTGAGIASVQQIGSASPVTAGLTNAQLKVTGAAVTDSSVSATNNLQRAIGYGNLASNDLRVAATTVTGDAVAGPGSTMVLKTTAPKTLLGSVTAGYGVLNDQSVLSSVSATAQASGSPSVQISTLGVTNSRVANEGNTVAAVAYGNNAASALTLTANAITTIDTLLATPGPGFSPVANITSTQAVSAAITATAIPGTVAMTSVTGNVLASTVSASSNTLESLATGSLSSNALNVTANSVVSVGVAAVAAGSDFSDSSSTVGANSTQSTTAAFSVQNVQSGQGSVMATQRAITVPSDVRIAVTGTVTGSSLTADANTSTASATSNSTVNALGLNAGSLASSSALQNVQSSSANVKALIGEGGVVGSLGGAFNYAYTGTSLAHNSGSNTLTAGTLSVNTSALNAAQITYLMTQGWASSGANTLSKSAIGTSMTALAYSTFSLGNSISASGTALATAAMPNKGGVTLAIGGNAVTDAQLSVSGNVTRDFAAGNRASNSTAVQGNDIATGSTLPVATTSITASTTVGLTTTVATVAADYSLSNSQNVLGQTTIIDSNVFGSMAIDIAPGANITGSSLKVSKNAQGASAVGNTASNSLALQGNSVKAVSALQSSQTSQATVSAASNLELFAPGGVSKSSVQISGNSNSALAVTNDVTNSLSVSGTKVGNANTATATSNGTIEVDVSQGIALPVATAEQALSNYQYANTALNSTATTRLYNQEVSKTSSNILDSSSLTLSGNSTAAEASANRALNTASVTATAKQAASVALGNVQASEANVTASATTTANLSLNNVAAPVALNSTVLIDGNSTTALARGNTATNALNSLAGSAYGTALGGTVDLKTRSTNANAGILNYQTNGNGNGGNGNVTATSTAATYMVALNSGNTGGSVGVTGNQVTAQAYGNSATNSMTLNALNTTTPGGVGATAAIGNYQGNRGNISANVNTVAYGVGITGPVTNSTLRTNGNQITAMAVGNSVASSILAAR